MRRAGLTAVFGALALAAAACGGAADTAGAPPGTTTTTTTTTVATQQTSGSAQASTTERASTSPKAVPEQLAFTATTLDGAPFDGASLLGKPAVFWFWTPWCPNCQREAPGVAKAAQEAGGEVSFVGVAAQDTEDAMRTFVERRGVGGFPHLADPDAAVWQRFGVTQQPSYAFVTADGKVEVVTRQLDGEDLLARVRALAGA